MNINILDSRKPFIPFAEFYNEPLSDAVEMDRDFANYKGESTGLYLGLCMLCPYKYVFIACMCNILGGILRFSPNLILFYKFNIFQYVQRF